MRGGPPRGGFGQCLDGSALWLMYKRGSKAEVWVCTGGWPAFVLFTSYYIGQTYMGMSCLNIRGVLVGNGWCNVGYLYRMEGELRAPTAPRVVVA